MYRFTESMNPAIYTSNPYSVAALYHFSTAIVNNDSLLNRLPSLPSFHICCLGAGHALTTLEICKVIAAALIELGSAEMQDSLKIYIQVIDSHKTLENYIRETVNETKKLLHKLNLKIASEAKTLFRRINICYDFLQEDLRTPFTKNISSIIQKADIVTMVKYCPKKLFLLNSQKALNEIVNQMKKGSWLFYLHEAESECHSVMKEVSHLKFSEIYSAILDGNSEDSRGVSFIPYEKNQPCCPGSKEINDCNDVEVLPTLCTVWVKLYPASKITGVKEKKVRQHITKALPRHDYNIPKLNKATQVNLFTEKNLDKRNYSCLPCGKAKIQMSGHNKDIPQRQDYNNPLCGEAEKQFQLSPMKEKWWIRYNNRKVVKENPNLTKEHIYRNEKKVKKAFPGQDWNNSKFAKAEKPTEVDLFTERNLDNQNYSYPSFAKDKKQMNRLNEDIPHQQGYNNPLCSEAEKRLQLSPLNEKWLIRYNNSKVVKENPNLTKEDIYLNEKKVKKAFPRQNWNNSKFAKANKPTPVDLFTERNPEKQNYGNSPRAKAKKQMIHLNKDIPYRQYYNDPLCTEGDKRLQMSPLNEKWWFRYNNRKVVKENPNLIKEDKYRNEKKILKAFPGKECESSKFAEAKYQTQVDLSEKNPDNQNYSKASWAKANKEINRLNEGVPPRQDYNNPLWAEAEDQLQVSPLNEEWWFRCDRHDDKIDVLRYAY